MQTATIYIQSAILSENGFDKTTPPEVAKLRAACAGVTGWAVYTSYGRESVRLHARSRL